jgi:hypothetical protein
MIELNAFQWFGLSIALPVAAAGIAGWLYDGLTTEPETDRVLTQLHHLPRAEYVRYVEGWDADAIQRSVQAQRPVVPPHSHKRSPYPHRRN